MQSRSSPLALVLTVAAAVNAQPVPPPIPSASLVEGQPRELGAVHWLRGFDAARAQARTTSKPLLVLFDEVPGCQNCVGFGKDVLTDALLVEAAETLFVPVAVFNNKPGEDARTLAAFGEPAWNNPVVRVIDPDTAKDLGPRVGDNYSVTAVASLMAESLGTHKAEVPGYLGLLASAAPGTRTERAVFAMDCFWEGEARLGSLEGVVSTRAGFVDGKECVEVEFDPGRRAFADLVKAARKADCLHTVYTRSAAQQKTAEALVGELAKLSATPFRASENDTKYQIRHSAYARVPMTQTQATRVNSALALGADPRVWLSPRQAALAK